MNKTITVFVPASQPSTKPIWYVLNLIGLNKNIYFQPVENPQSAQLILGELDMAASFFETLHKGIFSYESHFKKDCFIRHTGLSREHREAEAPQYLATIFYMVNCLQEYNAPEKAFDKYGRYRYAESFQHRFQNVTENLVQQCMDAFCESHIVLKEYAHQHQPSKILLTHDIDSLFGAWKMESRWALKKGRIGLMLKFIFEFFLQNHTWFNVDKILKIHTENDVKSTFFWITQQGKGDFGIKNADYDVKSMKIQEVLENILRADFEIGLHKSSLKTSFLEEMKALPIGHISANRFHFLKFSVPQSWQDLEKNAVAFDASLGFAEAYGFRNSYGLPFQPFDWTQQRTLETLVTPLNIMDGTLGDYMKIPVNQIQNHITDFLDKHKKNCLLTLLWHNTEFSEYSFQGYLDVYKGVLRYVKDNKMETTTVKNILAEYE
jgi:peptidoglycan/xylan/chitin deacetylase (PgdA/CDA1 family)